MVDSVYDAGQFLGQESSLSNWAGPYVTDMLGKGKGLSELPYTAYTGPLTAGASDLQSQAFSGLANISMPTDTYTPFTPSSYTDPGVSDKYMSPFLTNALEPQYAEARRQAEVSRVNNAGRLTQAGAYGGGRQAIQDSELDRNLMRSLTDITGRGYEQAYQQGRGQFNTEQGLALTANTGNRQYGMDYLQALTNAGGIQRGIEQQGIAADMNQFETERDYPYKQLQFQQSLLQGLPVGTQSYSYSQPSGLSNFGAASGGIMELLSNLGLDFNNLGGTAGVTG